MSDSDSDDDLPISRASANKKRKALSDEDEDEDDNQSEEDEDEDHDANGFVSENGEADEQGDGDDDEAEQEEESESEGDESAYEQDDGEDGEVKDLNQARGLVPEPPGSDDSSDDDVPLSKLAPSSKKKAAAATKSKTTTATKKKAKTTPPKKKAAATKKTAAASKKSATTTKKKKSDTSTTASSTTARSNYVSASTELYGKCEKGKLIQSLLCRWWYAFDWPDPSKLPKTPPPNTDSLDGFPGVYVYTRGESVGKLLDLRDKDSPNCPNFSNMCHKSSTELKELLLKAIDEQKRVLVKHQGSGSKTEKELEELRKWVNKLNAEKADKEAEKVLKAASLQLPPRLPVKKEKF